MGRSGTETHGYTIDIGAGIDEWQPAEELAPKIGGSQASVHAAAIRRQRCGQHWIESRDGSDGAEYRVVESRPAPWHPQADADGWASSTNLAARLGVSQQRIFGACTEGELAGGYRIYRRPAMAEDKIALGLNRRTQYLYRAVTPPPPGPEPAEVIDGLTDEAAELRERVERLEALAAATDRAHARELQQIRQLERERADRMRDQRDRLSEMLRDEIARKTQAPPTRRPDRIRGAIDALRGPGV